MPFSSIRSLVWLDPQGTTITKSTGRSTAELTFAVAESFPQEERETTVKTKAEGEKKEKAEGEKHVIYQDKVGSIRQKVENETNLTVTWKSAVLDAYGSEEYIKPMTNKERGQLAKIKKDLGPDTERIIAHTVHNWCRFGWEARSDCGQATFPGRPSIGYLLKHEGTAPRQWERYLQSIAPVPVLPESEQGTKSVHAISFVSLRASPFFS